ncbi:oxysterol-binding protein-related protein 8 isoform X1, partial [Lates japonicus]
MARDKDVSASGGKLTEKVTQDPWHSEELDQAVVCAGSKSCSSINHKNGQWVRAVLLNLRVVERPQRRAASAKLFHPLEQSIWACQGEAVGSITQPLPSATIFRAALSLMVRDRSTWHGLLPSMVLLTFILSQDPLRQTSSDYYYHADFLSEVEEALQPSQPNIGETYCCTWLHQRTNSKNLYIAGIPSSSSVSAFYASNRKDGFCPFLGSSDSVNQISGKIKLGKEVLATLEGHWDSEIFINDKKTGTVDTFWNPTAELRQSRLTRCTVPPEEQGEYESERLWQHVTRAINNKDQTEATNEKFILEEAQRKSARERKAKCEEWIPALFEQDPVTGEWHYRYADTRPWDPLNDLIQFEKDGCIQTKVRHRTPMVRSGSLISLSNQGPRRDNCKCQ